MKLKHWFALSLQFGLASVVMGGGAIVTLSTPVAAQLELIPDTAPDRTLGTRVGPSNSPQVDFVSGGTRPQNGPNVFHSFQEFNVRQNRGVYFASPNGVRNILTRVTGNDVSNILGTLGVSGTANLFLINPYGIIFGRNASLDLRGGSFYGSTASGLRFGDVGEFNAVDPQPPSNLLTINPSAFFFTAREQQGSIVNQSRATRTVLGGVTDGLRVQNGRNLLLLGGNVTLEGGRMLAPGGQINIAAVSEPGTVGLNLDGSLRVPDGLLRADVLLSNRALVNVQAGNRGTINITAGNIQVLGGSQIEAGINANQGSITSQAGDLTLDATGEIRVAEANSRLENNVETGARGNSGNIKIKTDTLIVTSGAQLSTSTFGTGNAGNVIIEARDRVVFSGTTGDGEFASTAFSRVDEGAIGKGGNVEITTGSLEVSNGARLNASTQGIGDAGNVIINARDRVLFTGISSDGFLSAAFSSVGEDAQGKGGNVQISTNTLEVLNGAQLIANTRGKGDAGNVIVNARDRVLFSGTTGDGELASTAFSRVNEGAIGKGGNVEITTGSLEVSNGARLNASTQGTGDAGNVIVNARDRVLFTGVSSDGFISAAFSSVGEDAQGKGGNVRISTNTLEVLNGAQLTASTSGIGNAGNVVIEARDRVLFSGRSADGRFGSNAFSSVGTEGQGQGGNVQISTNTLEILNGAQLSASTFGTGNAGNVIIEARDRVLFSGTSADGQRPSAAFSSVEAGAQGQGGSVQISTNTLEVLHGAQLIANTRGTGDAGNVIIEARDSVIVSGTEPRGRSSAVFASTSTAGQGGNISVDTQLLQVTEGGVIDARTYASGDSGNITINAEIVDILNGGQLLAITEGSGQAGSITINAADRLTISGSDPIYDSRLAQFGIRVAPISASSGIFVRSQDTGGAGDITVTAPQIRLDRGVISAESAAVDGGNITLNVEQLLLMRNGSLISATAGTAQQGGNGGNITINAPQGFIVGVKEENSDITANAFSGSGGRVNITAQGIFGLQFRPQLTEFSDITASSTFGLSGVVTLNTPNLDLNRGLIQLPLNLIDTNRLLANSCIVRSGKSGGFFLVTGTGGLPMRPGDLPLPSFATGEVRSLSNETSTQPPKPETSPVVEAQGIYQLPDGQVILSWECNR